MAVFHSYVKLPEGSQVVDVRDANIPETIGEPSTCVPSKSETSRKHLDSPGCHGQLCLRKTPKNGFPTGKKRNQTTQQIQNTDLTDLIWSHLKSCISILHVTMKSPIKSPWNPHEIPFTWFPIIKIKKKQTLRQQIPSDYPKFSWMFPWNSKK